MRLCRLPVAVVRLPVLISTAGWMVSAAQAAPLDQAHLDTIKIRGWVPLDKAALHPGKILPLGKTT
jgi:hypothetical protein